MHINFPWNFHQNISTLTIYFIVMNSSAEFVLIYRPHPVYALTTAKVRVLNKLYIHY